MNYRSGRPGEIIAALLDEIKAALQEGDKVQLIPFGSFVVRDRKKRKGRNPKTGAKLIIAAGPTEPNRVDAGQRRLLNAQVSHAA